ncbi:hypothetical protein Hanom_Chr07g00612281 [Helianthus anomalus]
MADQSAKSITQPSRLQRRALASIRVTPVSIWNVVIQLLSLLATPPNVKRNYVDISDDKPCLSRRRLQLCVNRWQHPAAPFYYEPASVAIDL